MKLAMLTLGALATAPVPGSRIAISARVHSASGHVVRLPRPCGVVVR